MTTCGDMTSANSVDTSVNYYHPQTKFAKVMFLHVSVCPRGRGSTWAGTHPGRYTPGRYTPTWQVHPHLAGTPPPGRYTPTWQVHPHLAGTPPPGRYTPAGTPWQVHPSGRYTPQGAVHYGLL